MIPREFDDANRRKKLERTPEQIQIANLKAEIKRLTDALEDCAALASFIDNADNVFSRCLFKVQKIAKAALKQGSNSDE